MYTRGRGTITYTTLTTFERCPLAYRLAYIDRVPEFASEAMVRGSEIHAEITDALRSGRRDGLSPLADRAVGWITERNPTLAVVEHPLTSCDLAGTPDVFMYVGENNDCIIVDYKTGYEIDGNVADSDQLRLYEWLLRCFSATIHENITLVRAYLAHNIYQVHESSPIESDAWFDGFNHRVDKLRRAHDTGDYPARIGGHCGNCNVRAYCDTYSTALVAFTDDPAAICDPAALGKLAVAARQAEVKIKEIRELVRAHCAENGPIEIDGETIGLEPTHTTNVDVIRAVRVLLDAGYAQGDILGTLKTTKTAIEKLIHGDKKTQESLRANAYQRVEKTELRWGKR